jgi:hypothetical protein
VRWVGYLLHRVSGRMLMFATIPFSRQACSFLDVSLTSRFNREFLTAVCDANGVSHLDARE